MMLRKMQVCFVYYMDWQIVSKWFRFCFIKEKKSSADKKQSLPIALDCRHLAALWERVFENLLKMSNFRLTIDISPYIIGACAKK